MLFLLQIFRINIVLNFREIMHLRLISDKTPVRKSRHIQSIVNDTKKQDNVYKQTNIT